MALSATRSTCLASRRSTNCRTSRPSRATVVVRANFTLKDATDWVAKGFMQIFSPPQSNVETFAENNFTGKISRSRRPFKDGFQGKPLPAEALQRDESKAEGYLDGAVKRVVNNNFTGDSTEPTWTNATGWTGDIHNKASRRDAREGFHSKKL